MARETTASFASFLKSLGSGNAKLAPQCAHLSPGLALVAQYHSCPSPSPHIPL